MREPEYMRLRGKPGQEAPHGAGPTKPRNDKMAARLARRLSAFESMKPTPSGHHKPGSLSKNGAKGQGGRK